MVMKSPGKKTSHQKGSRLVAASPSMPPQDAVGGAMPNPMIPQGRFDQYGHANVRRKQDEERRHGLWRHVEDHYPPLRRANAPRGFHVGRLPHGQRHGADHPCPECNPGERDGDNHSPYRCAQYECQHHRQDQPGYRHEDFQEALADQINFPTQISADQPPHGAPANPEKHRRQRNEQGDAAAVDYAAQ